MSQPKGLIYLRDNLWFIIENVIKMGMASFAKDRSSTYITGEVIAGNYIWACEIPLNKLRIIDNLLKIKFKEFNIYKGGGTEFYNRSIIGLIEPYIQSLLKEECKVLSKEEIDNMTRCERLRTIPNIDKLKIIINQLNIQNIIQKLKDKKNKKNSNTEIIDLLLCKPNRQQQTILEMIEGFYDLNDIGKLIWACGLGKALLSILIVNLLKFKSVVFGVPSKNLQKQITREILKIFPNKNNILLVGGDEENGIKSASSGEEIIAFLNNNNNNILTTEPKFVISTYHSCHLLVDTDISVDFKIGDEAHHLVGIEREEERGFRLFHKITSKKSLFMTATEKTIETRANRETYSMEDETVFGKYIDIKSVYWAIENKKITDYNIVILKNTEDEVDDIISSLRINVSNKELFMSCYMCLKSFDLYKDLSHVLLYTNTIDDADLATKYIAELLELDIVSIKKDDIYNNALHSKNCRDLETEINKFKNAIYGIIPCVYIFGEGFDLPKLNGVCIAGNMQSETRIVQYLLRPNRLEIGNPNKKAYIIIPYTDSDDWETKNKSYDKVKHIVSQMRNVDENIEQKIQVYAGINKKKEKKENNQQRHYEDYEFEENSEEMSKIKMRLRYSKALGSKFSEEQDEHNYVKSINRSLDIQSKKQYIEKKHIHCNFIDFPEEYFKAKGVWTNWYDFIGVDTTKFIQSKQDWINFCKEKNIKSLDEYYKSCEIYEVLPKDPADFYYKDFTNIPTELGFNRTRR